VLLTGGLGLDDGLLLALQEACAEGRMAVEVRSHPDAIYAGAIGAALWGAFRHEKLQAQSRLAMAS
jgi:benzoyl-CoA reductase subunit D